MLRRRQKLLYYSSFIFHFASVWWFRLLETLTLESYAPEGCICTHLKRINPICMPPAACVYRSRSRDPTPWPCSRRRHWPPSGRHTGHSAPRPRGPSGRADTDRCRCPTHAVWHHGNHSQPCHVLRCKCYKLLSLHCFVVVLLQYMQHIKLIQLNLSITTTQWRSKKVAVAGRWPLYRGSKFSRQFHLFSFIQNVFRFEGIFLRIVIPT